MSTKTYYCNFPFKNLITCSHKLPDGTCGASCFSKCEYRIKCNSDKDNSDLVKSLKSQIKEKDNYIKYLESKVADSQQIKSLSLLQELYEFSERFVNEPYLLKSVECAEHDCENIINFKISEMTGSSLPIRIKPKLCTLDGALALRDIEVVLSSED